MKIAVITGASSGIGRVFATKIPYVYPYLDEIWVFARRGQRLRQLAAKSCIPVRIFEGDLQQKEIFKQYKNALTEENPEIRLLINAAGFGKMGITHTLPVKEQLGMIDINCRALTRMTLQSLPYMHAGARIIQVASAAAFCPQTGFNIYAATKAYVVSFSRGLNSELRDRHIYVTAVCPGPVDTEFFQVSGTIDSKLKKISMLSADKIVAKALRDSRKKKEVSVCGLQMKAAQLGAKLLPHKFVVRLMQKL